LTRAVAGRLSAKTPAAGADSVPQLLSIKERERRDRERSKVSSLSTQTLQQLQQGQIRSLAVSSRWDEKFPPEVDCEDEHEEDDVSMMSGIAWSDTSSHATSAVTHTTFNSLVSKPCCPARMSSNIIHEPTLCNLSSPCM
jgi:hypothetical protein